MKSKKKKKIVSAVGFCFLTLFWIWLSFLSAPGLTVLLLEKKRKSLLLIAKPAEPVLQIFLFPAGRGGLGSVLPFLWLGFSLSYHHFR